MTEKILLQIWSAKWRNRYAVSLPNLGLSRQSTAGLTLRSKVKGVGLHVDTTAVQGISLLFYYFLFWI